MTANLNIFLLNLSMALIVWHLNILFCLCTS